MKTIILKLIAILVILNISFLFISTSYGATISDTMSGANAFVKSGEKEVNSAIDNEKLGDASKFIYNVLLAVAIIMAVVIGVVLGIKFMISSVEEKAQIKELLMPYVIGCIVIFGAFGIWKIAVMMFKGF